MLISPPNDFRVMDAIKCIRYHIGLSLVDGKALVDRTKMTPQSVPWNKGLADELSELGWAVTREASDPDGEFTPNVRELLQTAVGDDIPLVFADGFDDCIIGLVERFDGKPAVAYDRQRIFDKLMPGSTYEEVVEHFEYNILGAWVGDYTPVYIRTLRSLGEEGDGGAVVGLP